MKIVTWNVNSINSRMELLLNFLASENPDICLLQEIKTEEAKFPYEALSHLPYNIYVSGQKSYNGVAILSKFQADEISKNFPGNPLPGEARFIEGSFLIKGSMYRIISLYVPNGGEVGSDKFQNKLIFLEAFCDYVESIKRIDEKTAIGGDFNVAPFDIDVYSAEELKNSTCFTHEEKTRMRKILNLGMYDLFRLSSPSKREFSWWDYRAGAFEKNAGMRIDTILASAGLAQKLDNCRIAYETRALVKPSDHAPVIAVLNKSLA